MKVYIITDMEGVSGICRESQVVPGTPDYEAARRLLCADVNAAIAGAFSGGATAVVVCDGHHSGSNLILTDMDERATFERPAGPRDLMPSIDATFGGLFCIGYHAMAGTIDAFLDHTHASTAWHNYHINGRRCGELAQVGAWAGHWDIAVLLVTGDQAACNEAREFFPGVEAVAVKQGQGRLNARCIPPMEARNAIFAAAERAMKLASTVPVFRPAMPLTVRLEYSRSDLADSAAGRGKSRRVDARTVERVVDDVREILNF